MLENNNEKPVLTSDQVVYYYAMGRFYNTLPEAQNAANAYPGDLNAPTDPVRFLKDFEDWYRALAYNYYQQGRMSAQVDMTFEEIFLANAEKKRKEENDETS